MGILGSMYVNFRKSDKFEIVGFEKNCLTIKVPDHDNSGYISLVLSR